MKGSGEQLGSGKQVTSCKMNWQKIGSDTQVALNEGKQQMSHVK